MKKIASKYAAVSRKAYSVAMNPSASQLNKALALTGVAVLVGGTGAEAFAGAAGPDWAVSGGPGSLANDGRLTEAVGRSLGLLEGSFGALIMVAAGLGAIISAAFGAYRAAVGLLVVAVGAFILRSLIGIFFNQNAATITPGG